MRDFEEYEQEMQQVGIDQTDLHADKTANATILIEKQRWVYKKYEFYTHQIEKAQRLIKDEEARKAIEYRYIQGFTRKETMLFFRRSLSDSTIKRKIDEGITSIANFIKIDGDI
ncbi:hypothetical protein [Paenibacillus sp. LK1]|uniref:hypothetical protein n=1 Tax=Paenibacillus sp. LK1 TaxID=2053014 RepID=UPI00211E6B7F|nr:hypothetical protein [Paenibacillus sp. LK1]